GTVEEGEKTVTYIYKKVETPAPTPDPKTGSVLVRHITEDGTVLEGPSDVVRDGEVGSDYSTSVGNFPGYTFVKVDETGAPSTGTVEEGEKTVTYIYKKVETPAPTPKGSVIVKYVDETGKEIKAPVTDTKDADVSSPYDTKDNKPSRITFEGDTYELVKFKDGDKEVGVVVEGQTTVTYIYKKVEKKTPIKQAGTVTVYYEDENGNLIKTPNPIAPSGTEAGTGYDSTTSTNRPEKIIKDGVTYVLVQKEPKQGSDSPTGKVEAGKDKTITYVYKKVTTTPEAPSDQIEPTNSTSNKVGGSTGQSTSTVRVVPNSGARRNLPSTGDSVSIAATIGLTALSVLTLGQLAKNRQRDEK
ncbi:MucBP domain-containing protein, partial [Streptococcus rupicaprae]